MAEHDIAIRDPSGVEREPCAEGEVIDQDRVGCDILDHREGRARTILGLPHEVGQSFPGLIEKRRDHAVACRVEEAFQRRRFLGLLLRRADDARIRAATEGQIDPPVPEALHDGVRRRARRHDNLLAALAPRGCEGCQGEQVRCVVGTDDEQCHAAPAARTSSASCSATRR